MQAIYALLEEIDEMAYISDTETYELVYMNRKLREKLGYSSTESYKGMKCYNVLQSKKKPCNFCNNPELQTKNIVTWTYENPVMKQKMLVRDRLFRYDGHSYRIEIVTKAQNIQPEKITNFSNDGQAIINNCLQCFFASQDPEKSIDLLLEYLGQTFHSARSYIFEFDSDDIVSNTYEWCSPQAVPQKEILQKLLVRDISYWIQAFEQHKAVLLYDIEDIRTAYPATYCLLHPQKIVSLIVVPIYEGQRLEGFIGIDNPEKGTLPLLEQVLQSMGSSLAIQLRRRNLYLRFNEMSYRDSLTGAYNRNAMEEHCNRSKQWNSFGVVYCDINGLKETNDIQGHNAGNKLLQECYDVLRQALRTEWIYRVGGDEFAAFYCNTDEEQIKRDLEILRLEAMKRVCRMSVGYAWSNQYPVDTEKIIDRADAMMYQEKLKYYEQIRMQEDGNTKGCGNRRNISCAENRLTSSQKQLHNFLLNTYCDIPFLLALLETDNRTSYFFFGDMQKNLFYISENMRVKFGFESNIVEDLIHRWASRIEDQALLERFWADINNMLEGKQNRHDLRYPIADANGNNVWIRCVERIKWSEDGTTPLFLAGRMSQQDEVFVVDSLTNFPTETALLQHLSSVKKRNQTCWVIGISFNNISQINSNLGRLYGDDLIRGISEKLYDKLSQQMTFYRMNGMRCVALTESSSLKAVEKKIEQIKEIIEKQYHRMGLALQSPCSFVLLNYPREDESPQDFIENITSLTKISRSEPNKLYIDNSKGEIQKIQDSSNMELRLSQDILNRMENFRVVMQPIVATQNRAVIGGEILLRWKFEGKDVSPAVFIPIIEQQKMIDLVGRWVFEQAVRVCRRILSYDPDFYVTVNASLQQLSDDGLINFVRDTLEKYHIKGKHFVIEMTESCMDEQPEKLVGFVEACSNMGIRIALDDFGSGYSSLRVLLQYPSNIIKLDRSLLLEMSDSFAKNNFITCIVYACHQFDKKVCMEGVETEFQNELVREAGCDMIQGFYYYRPMEIEQTFELLSQKCREKAEKNQV